MEEGSSYTPYGDKKEKERPARFGKKEWRADLESYYFSNLWKVGESPSPYAYRADPGDHEPFFILERSGEARRNVWAALRFPAAQHPPWLEQDEAVPVFLPLVYLADVPGEPLACLELDGRRFAAVSAGGRSVRFAFDPVLAIDFHLAERNASLWQPFPWRLEVPSRVLHHGLQRHLEQRSVKRRKEEILAGVNGSGFVSKGQEALRWLIRQALGAAGARISGSRPLWSGGLTHAVCVTHEIGRAPRGRWIEETARLEREKGIPATWFLPGEKPPGRYSGFLDRLRSAGNEIALLGDVFRPPLALGSDIAIRHALDRCREFLERWHVRGFRSSVLISSPVQRKVLAEFGLYDSSTIDFDPFYPTAPERGCGSVHPFRIHGNLEIPVTLPGPENLAALGLPPAEILKQWRNKLDWIRQTGGVAVIRMRHFACPLGRGRGLRLSDWLSLYENLLEAVKEDDRAWKTTLAAVSERCAA